MPALLLVAAFLSKRRFVSTAIAFCAMSFLFTAGCQTSRYKEFETLHGGMTKADVLAMVGNPTRAQRWHGRDRWEYTFYGQPGGDIVREVHFENGKSSYIGPAIKPAISADEQDRINDRRNREADLRDSEQTQSDSTGVQVQRFEPVKDSNDEIREKSAAQPGVSP